MFLSDQFTLGRATLSLGVRYDRYRSWMPEQRQLANKVGPLSIPDQTFPEQTFATFNAIAPRVGMTYDLFGTGKSVVKLNYGFYRHNPGVGLAGQSNPNQENKNATYQWTDNAVCAGCIPGNGHYEVGEEGNQTGAALAGNVTVDPNLKQPYLEPGDGLLRAAVDGGGRLAHWVRVLLRSKPVRHVPALPSGLRVLGAVLGSRSGPGRAARDC